MRTIINLIALIPTTLIGLNLAAWLIAPSFAFNTYDELTQPEQISFEDATVSMIEEADRYVVAVEQAAEAAEEIAQKRCEGIDTSADEVAVLANLGQALDRYDTALDMYSDTLWELIAAEENGQLTVQLSEEARSELLHAVQQVTATERRLGSPLRCS